MLTIRLQRRGRKNDPSFRVILTESKHKPKTGKYLEMLGSYDARTNRVDLVPERIKYWISQGVTVSGTVHNLLISQKVIEGTKINVLNKKTPPKPKEEAKASEVAAPATAAAEASAVVAGAAEEAQAEPQEDNAVAPETQASVN